MPRTYEFKNPLRIKLAKDLRKEGKEKEAKIWTRLNEELLKSKKHRREVNIWKINKYTKKDETVVIPGKVLGCGTLDHRVNIAAFTFSKAAEEKIKGIGGEIFSIEELMKRNPTGSGVKILG